MGDQSMPALEVTCGRRSTAWLHFDGLFVFTPQCISGVYKVKSSAGYDGFIHMNRSGADREYESDPLSSFRRWYADI